MKNIFFVSYCTEQSIVFDKHPDFDIIVLRYGNAHPYPCPMYVKDIVDVKTECKGDLMELMYEYLRDNYDEYDYASFFDDDIIITVSDIEECYKIAQLHELDAFAPSLTPDSHASYDWTKNTGSSHRVVPTFWVEVMMPSYSKRFLDFALEPTLKVIKKHNIKSGWGIDQEIGQKALSKIDGKGGIIHEVQAKHYRPVTSHNTVFSNGKTARQEWDILKEVARTEEPWAITDYLPIDMIYYINLDKRADRKHTMEEGLKRIQNNLGIPFERFTAVCPDPNTLEKPAHIYRPYRDRFSLNVEWSINGKNLERSAGMLGAYLSHLSLYHKIKESGYKRVLVLEDDFMITENTLIELNKYELPEDWELLRHGWWTSDTRLFRHYNHHCQSKYEYENKTGDCHNNFGGAHFIYINVERIGNVIEALNNDFVYDIDGALNNPEIANYFAHLKDFVLHNAGTNIPKTVY